MNRLKRAFLIVMAVLLIATQTSGLTFADEAVSESTLPAAESTAPLEATDSAQSGPEKQSNPSNPSVSNDTADRAASPLAADSESPQTTSEFTEEIEETSTLTQEDENTPLAPPPYGGTISYSGICGVTSVNSGNNVKWDLYDDGTLVIWAAVTNSAMRDGTGLSSFTWNAYRNSIKRVIVEDGVTSIGNYAFGYTNSTMGISILETVYLADSVLTIGDSAFSHNLQLREFRFSDSLTSIASNAFTNCYRLEKVLLPDSLLTIGSRVFSGCSSVDELVLSANLTTIGDNTFSSMSGLVRVGVNGISSNANLILPASLTTISKSAFSGSFKAGLGTLSIIIPSTVTTIKESAFRVNTGNDTYGYNLVSVTVQRMSVDDLGSPVDSYSGYDASAFPRVYSYLDALVVFPNKNSYTDFYAKSSTSDARKALTYQVSVEFYNSVSAPSPSSTEPKLYGKSLSFVKSPGGIWSYDSAYALPDPSGTPVENGYYPEWVLINGGSRTPVAISTIVKGDMKVYLDKALINPTIKGTVDQVITSNGTPYGGFFQYDLTIPDNRYGQTPYVKVGVNVDHPLLNTNDSDGGHVEFKYFWTDVQWYVSGGSSFYTDGPRNWSEPSMFSKLVNNNYITIPTYNDVRNADIVDGSLQDGRYEVVVVGYYIDSNNVATRFYQSKPGVIAFNSSQLGAYTDNTVYILSISDSPISITYDLNGGNISGNGADVVWPSMAGYSNLGAYPDPVPSPVYPGYVLTGWKDLSTNTIIALGNMNTQAVTVTKKYEAVWSQRIAVTYKYTDDGGTTWKTYTGYTNETAATQALSGDYLTAPSEDPAVTGYDFKGWYTSNALTTKWNFTTDKAGTSNITLYAKMDPIAYSITYTLNGGTYTPSDTNPTSYTVEDLPLSLNSPEKIGHTFMGWTAEVKSGEQGSVSFSDPTIQAGTWGNLVLTAAFTSKPVTITYYPGYGANTAYTSADMSNATAASTGTYNGEVTRPIFYDASHNPTRAGYYFAGWKVVGANPGDPDWIFTGEANPATKLTLAQGLVEGTNDFTLALEAQWVQKTVISYEYSNDGGTTWLTYSGFTNEADTIHPDASGKITAPAEDPSVIGYSFDGWFTSKTFTTEWNFATDVVGNNDMTLYAKMTPIAYAITYVLDGGATTPPNINPATYTIEDPDITLVAPAKAGYTFAGWTAELTTYGKGNLIFNDPAIKAGTYGDLTLTATYSAKPVTITYTQGYGADVAYTGFFNEATATRGVYDGTVERPVFYNASLNPVREGYTFTGWAVKNTGTPWTFDNEINPTKLTGTNGLIDQGIQYSLHLVAQWSLGTYQVTFDSQGADDAALIDPLILSLGYGSVISNHASFPATPTKTGYIFRGWKFEDGTMLQYNNTTMPARNVHLTAVWESTAPGSSIVAVDFTHNYDSGNFTVALVNQKAGPVVYDQWGQPTSEVPTFTNETLDSLNSVRDSLNYDSTARVQVTYTNAAGDQATITVTIWRGPAPYKPDPKPEPPKTIVVTNTVIKYVTVKEVITETITKYVMVPSDDSRDDTSTPRDDAEKDKDPAIQIVPGSGSDSSDSSSGTKSPEPTDPNPDNNSSRVDVVIPDTPVPLGQIGAVAHWSILSLILVIVGAVTAIVHFIFGLRRRKKTDDDSEHTSSVSDAAYFSALDSKGNTSAKHSNRTTTQKRSMTAVRILAIIIGVAAIFLLLFLEDYSLDAAWLNQWTILFSVLCILELLCTAFHFFTTKKKEDANGEASER